MPDESKINWVESQWKSYKNKVIPSKAHPGQVAECKQAFYAGAHGMRQLLNRIAEKDVSEEQAMRLLDRADTEIAAYVQAVSAGWN